MTTTTTLEQALQDYLTVRRALGFKLAENGRQLADFVDYLHGAGASTVTTELALAWATQPIGCLPVCAASPGHGRARGRNATKSTLA